MVFIEVDELGIPFVKFRVVNLVPSS